MQAESSFRVRRLPRPGALLSERRRTRSDAAGEALQLALNRAAERAGLDAVVVSDSTGMLVANSATHLDLAMLAAIMPLVGRGQVSAAIKRQGKGRDLTVRPIDLDDDQLFVAALGGRHGDRLREVAASTAAVKRILL